MEKYVITEDEKNRILNLHIERTKNLYLTEQQNKLTSEMKETLINAGYQEVNGSLTKIKKFPSIPKLNKDVRAWIKPDGTYHIDSLPITNVPAKILAKGVWTMSKPTDAASFSWNPMTLISDTPTPTPVTNDIREWAKCIKDTPDFKNIKNQNDENKVAQKDASLKTWDVFYKDGTYEYLKEDGTTISVGKWKCFQVVGLIIELDNGKKYFNKKWQGDNDGIKIPSLDTIKEKAGTIIGIIGDKLIKWYDQAEKWLEDNSGGGSSDNGSSNDNKPCTPLTDSEKKGDDFYNIRIPGDTKYIYGKDGKGNWFTKNIVNTNQFNLTKCKYDKAIKKLEKEGKQVSSPQKTELDNTTSAPNDKVNVAWVEPKPKPETTPLATSDKVTDGQEEMSATTKL
jgi:hypothetical protein